MKLRGEVAKVDARGRQRRGRGGREERLGRPRHRQRHRGAAALTEDTRWRSRSRTRPPSSASAQTEFSKNSGRSELQLACEAVRAAIADAGLKPSQIDGMTTFTMDLTDDIEIARSVGIGGLTFQSQIPHGGGAALGVLHAGGHGGRDRRREVRGLLPRPQRPLRPALQLGRRPATCITSDAIHWSWYIPSGLMTPTSWVAMVTRRYMHETGTTSRDLGQVAVSTRKHAVVNPDAIFYQRPLTLEEHQASRMIVDPLRLYDCCLETDGACACIVTTPERARDLAQPPALIRARRAGRRARTRSR